MNRQNAHLLARNERGATAALVALLFGGFVVTGLLAWSADAGQIFWERRQTQNAADAAALALAQSCAKNNCKVNADGLPDLINANTVNNANRTHDTLPGASGQCIANPPTGLVTTLPLCVGTGSVSDLAQCPVLPPAMSSGLPYVEVRVRANGTAKGLIPNPFTRVNDTGPDDAHVVSCARAAWGTPSSAAFLAPFTISLCEWDRFTNHGVNYAPPPVGNWPGYGGPGQPAWPAGFSSTAVPREIVIRLHGNGDSKCAAGPSGADAPGGFGWLSGPGCIATATTTNGTDFWAPFDPGSSPPSGCSAKIAAARDSGPLIDLPIYNCIRDVPVNPITPATNCDDGHGSNGKYHLAGVARFYVSGYKIGGSDERPSRVTGTVPCSGNDRCVSGWFVQGVLNLPSTSITPPTPGNGFGLTAVLPAG
ncbi:pilus assembly protein TadG-related protein [Knoellia sp. LjRoot47]|uniref:pilus assembly protein TadG-related protein n=1 Tax=Knoellia sp. LjRoot47 TaxID=3342330 RepID=UPI003ED14BB0